MLGQWVVRSSNDFSAIDFAQVLYFRPPPTSTIYIYIYTLAAYLHELGGLDYLKFRGGRLIGA